MSREGNSSLSVVLEIIKQREAVGLRPDSDFAGVLESVVGPFNGFLAIKGDGEVVAVKIHSQGVPLVGRDLHVCSFLLGAFAFDGMIDSDIVFEGVGASNV